MSRTEATQRGADGTPTDRRTLRELAETLERLLASGNAAVEQLRTITGKAA